MDNVTLSHYSDDYFYDYDDSSVIYLNAGESVFGLFSIVSCSLIFCLSVSGNTFLLWVLLRERAWKTTADVLLLHLTVSALCFTVTLPFWGYYHLHRWIFGDLACKVIRGTFFLGLYSYMAFLTAVTLDHYASVVRASSTSTQVRRRFYAILTSIGIWVVCAAVSPMEAVNAEARDHQLGGGGIECVEASPLAVQIFGLYLQIGLFSLLPFSTITFCHVRMWMTIKQCRLRRRHLALRLTSGVIVVFFICWAPYNVVLFIQSLMLVGVQLPNTSGWNEAMQYGYYISHTLAYCHLCLNPLFSVFGVERFRRSLPMPCRTSCLGRGRSQGFSRSLPMPCRTSCLGSGRSQALGSPPHSSVSQQTCV